METFGFLFGQLALRLRNLACVSSRWSAPRSVRLILQLLEILFVGSC